MPSTFAETWRAATPSTRLSRRKLEYLSKLAARPRLAGRKHVGFCGSSRRQSRSWAKDGRVVGLRIEQNEIVRNEQGHASARGTGRFETIPVGLVFRSVGYRGVPIAGLPFDERQGIVPNRDGRVLVDGRILAFRLCFGMDQARTVRRHRDEQERRRRDRQKNARGSSPDGANRPCGAGNLPRCRRFLAPTRRGTCRHVGRLEANRPLGTRARSGRRQGARQAHERERDAGGAGRRLIGGTHGACRTGSRPGTQRCYAGRRS